MQSVAGQFPRISFLSISFLSISCTAMLPFLDKIPILCEARHLLSPKLSGKLLSITFEDSFNGIYGRWALLCLLWFPWLFHTLSMILNPPETPLSLFAFNRWESRSHHSLYIHSTMYWREVLCFSPSISAKRKHFLSFSPAVHHQLWVPALSYVQRPVTLAVFSPFPSLSSLPCIIKQHFQHLNIKIFFWKLSNWQ